MKNILSKKWTSCPNQLTDIRKSITTTCQQLSFSESDINAIVLAVDEACTNVIRYAYHDCRDGEILLEISIDDNQAVFRLHDYASKVSEDCLKVKSQPSLMPGGLGVMLMHKVMDSIKFIHTENCKGNILEMRIQLPKETY